MILVGPPTVLLRRVLTLKGNSPNNFVWFLLIPTIVGTVLGPVAGRASDLFGRKYIQMGASIFGIVGSAIATKTNSMRVLMVASALYGIGYAGHQLALVSIVETLPRRRQALAIGIFIGSLLPAAGFGPLIAAALTLHSSWRAIYWLAIGLYLFSLIGTFLFYNPHELRYRETDVGEKLKKFDYLGTFIFLSACSLKTVGLTFGGTVFPW